MKRVTAVALGVALSAVPVLTVSTSAFALASNGAVPAASEPSINDFLTAAAQVKVLVNGKEYKDFNYMNGIDASKLLMTKKAEVSYPMQGGTAIPDNAKVTLANVPSDFSKYITSNDVASGTDVVAKASGYTITYHFNYKRTATETPKKGDVNKDGKYDVKDLAGVRATVGGKDLDSFKPDQAGPYRILVGSKVEVSGVPAGWSAKAKSTSTGVIITVSDPDGKDVIAYTFVEASSPGTPGVPSTPGKDDNGNGSSTPSTPGKSDDNGNGSGTVTPATPSGDTTDTGQDAAKTVDVPNTNANVSASQDSDANLAKTGVGAESVLAVMAAAALAGSVMGVRRRITD